MADNSQNTQTVTKNTKEIIFKDLSFKIVGLMFDLIKSLGGDYQEKFYQRGFEKFLIKNNILFKKELPVSVELDGEVIGKHYVDFVVDNKIIVEFKKGTIFRIGDVKQVLMYLKSLNYRLGILAYFSSKGVRIKRIINKYFS